MYQDVFNQYPMMVVGAAVVLGLIVGSFLNVVIYRLPLMMEREWKQECRLILELDSEPQPSDSTEIFNLIQPNSRCPQCGAAIKPWHNIPVISYLMLGGKCANCSQPISARYPIIEAVTGLLSGIVAWQLGYSIEALTVLGLTWALIALTMIDVDHKLLPDQITLPLLWAGLIVNSFGFFVPLGDALWGAVAGYLSLWSVYWGFKILTGKEGMGFGDFKLLAALGAWMGWQYLLLIILLSSVVGAVVGISLIVFSKNGRDTQIPFGPYLAAAGWIAFLWGEGIINGYLQFAGVR